MRRGGWSRLPGSAVVAAGSVTPRRRCSQRARRSASSRTADGFRRSPPISAESWWRHIARRRRRLLDPPTAAELTVLRLLDTDQSVRQIGEELFLSANTVRTHKRSIYRKLSVNSRADAVARASALGLIGGRIHPGESGDPMGDGGKGTCDDRGMTRRAYRVKIEGELGELGRGGI